MLCLARVNTGMSYKQTIMRSVFSSQSPPLLRGACASPRSPVGPPGCPGNPLCPATAPYSSTTCGTGRMEVIMPLTILNAFCALQLCLTPLLSNLLARYN
ncbi:hypothetical protein CDAR_305651 [Caerostris darwini]|uniref:Uncharacterized protein n=1 Tax=Caerostris darwini TaxID=1538125 RepID=A0AAV4P7S6_9ARAC|nr:hypothetical protein CDAR_305651 [Caerostris darwini]